MRKKDFITRISRQVVIGLALIFSVTSLFAMMPWTNVTNGAGWSKRCFLSSVVFNNEMWVLGGGYVDTTHPYTGYNDVWYSTNGADWAQATASAGWSKRGDQTVLVYDNKMWVLGGANYDTTTGYIVCYNDVWYSTDGQTWVQETASAGWPARAGHTSLVYDNKMWVMGGQGNSNTYYNDVWYSTDGKTWTNVTNNAGWSKRYLQGALVYDNKMWVMGGFDNTNYKRDVWYSTDGGNWMQATALAGWSARDCFASDTFGNAMWVLGGCDDTTGDYYGYNDVWYSTDGISWIQATASAGWPARATFTSPVFDNKIWVMGGIGAGIYNDVWYSTGLGVNEERSPVISGLSVFPNPFIENTTISYSIPTKTKVLLTVHDVTGRAIKTLVNEVKEAGNYKVEFSPYGTNGEKLSSGVYFVSLKTGNHIDSKRLIRL